MKRTAAWASPALFIVCSLISLVSAKDWIREPGRCSMIDSCGRKGGIFGQSLPCASNEPARPIDASLRASLESVCGVATTEAWERSCCTSDQLETLQANLQQAEPLLALCPACKLNFRDFFCSFTCHPDQSTFVSVVETQNLNSRSTAATAEEIEAWITAREEAEISTVQQQQGPAVKRIAFHVDEQFGRGFFDSCKNVKFGATNGYAMDLIGGGAKDWLGFVNYMGTERPGLGSPFTINFPQPANTLPDHTVDATIQAYNKTSRTCASPGEDRCACADCPEVCLELPAIESPAEERRHQCHVGRLSCFNFALLLVYCITAAMFFSGVGLRSLWRRKDRLLGGLYLQKPRLRQQTSSTSSHSGNDRVQLEESGLDDQHQQNQQTDSLRSASTRSHQVAASTSSGGLGTHSPDASLAQRRLGRGASLLGSDALGAHHQPRTYALNTFLSNIFYRIGHFCAYKPYLTIAFGLVLCGVANSGWSQFAIEKDPVKLWVAKGSDSERNKAFFEESFGPFYRTEQIFVAAAADSSTASLERSQGNYTTEGGVPKWQPVDRPVLTWDRIQWWSHIEKEIQSLKSPQGTTLQDVCFSPAGSAESVEDCVVESPLAYFGTSLDGVDEASWQEQLDQCAASPSLCLTPSGMPLNPRLVFGGVPGYSGKQHGAEIDSDSVPAHKARAITITYVVANSLDSAIVRRAEEWEETLRLYLVDLAKRAPSEAGLQIAYSTGVSLEQELNKSTNTDVPIVVFSYLLMFVYVSFSLGGSLSGLGRIVRRIVVSLWRRCRALATGQGAIRLEGPAQDSSTGKAALSTRKLIHRALLESKFVLGLWGILIVLLSVSTSVGIFSFAGVKITLIIAEVIPFLVLAIGVDNVFLLAHELERQNNAAYSAMARHGVFGHANLVEGEDHHRAHYDEDLDGVPSPEERVARALGRMGPSIFLSSFCQGVCFSLGALVGMPAVRNFAIYAAGGIAINAVLQVTVFVSAMAIDLTRTEASRVDCVPCIQLPTLPVEVFSRTPSALKTFIQTKYAPFLLHRQTKRVVVAVFAFFAVFSVIGTQRISLGLDQRLALPAQSHLVDYFNALEEFLDVGPPVYFVATGLNMSSRGAQQEECGRFSACKDMSIANILEAERKRPESSFLAEPPAVWIDDFLQWLNPVLETCCRVKRKDPTQFCSPDDPDIFCIPCYELETEQWNITMEGLPTGDQFLRYLEEWLVSPTDESCPLGGRSSYSSAVELATSDNGTATAVSASHFRTYHTALKSQSNYIDSMAAAHRISQELSDNSGAHVFPYSVHFVFFDQYATIQGTAQSVLLLAVAAVFGLVSLVLGSWRTGAVVAATVSMSTLNVVGLMGFFDINLNAVSLVNLVISVGIAVEFCSHIARAFMSALGGGLPFKHPAGPKERDERAWAALSDVGSSVFSGITLTKLVGIAVLALTKSKLLRTYYFKMWLSLIVSGALHGLIFLPVLLSLQGGQGYSSAGAETDDSLFVSDHMSYSRPFLSTYDEDEDSTVEEP